ncbi:MAG TPA: hypothetical protein ENN86_02785 [Desulfobacteraceae bacterium]|nr:hypothetical protein [Desulfobacteraceae bacterium]
MEKAAYIMKTLASEEPPWTLDNLSEIHIRENKTMSLYFSHVRAEIILRSDELAGKIQGLRKVSQHLMQTDRIENVNRIDLDYKDGAVVSFKRG